MTAPVTRAAPEGAVPVLGVLPCGCVPGEETGCRYVTGTITPPAAMAALVAPHTLWVKSDGGRAAAGYKGSAGDCACRAIAIATGRPYQEVYDLIIAAGKTERKSKRKRSRSHPRTGVYSATMHRLITRDLGGTWTPTMTIGSGTTVHLRADELPSTGRHVLRVSKHYAAWVDGVLYDTHDCARGGERAVYGYWTFP